VKILTICSALDFINYTRRATIESIHKLNPDLDVLMFNSVLNLRRKKNLSPGIKFYFYHFWVVEKLRKIRVLPFFEHFLRSFKWIPFFRRYDLIFFIDPNQYYLLPYMKRDQKLIYLLRDPSILLYPGNFRKELPIINRANLILGVSKSLCNYYFKKYYEFIPDNIKLWPNTVDIELWNYHKWVSFIRKKVKPLIGFAGNIDYVIDIGLLIFITKNLPEYDFEIAGKLNLNNEEQILWAELLTYPNVKYLGFISFNDFPQVVINWDIGLVAAKPDHEYALYLSNNKQYQYLALGKPFVSYKLDAEYDDFEDFVFIAEDQIDYVEKIKQAVIKAKDRSIIERGIKIASEQSSECRAKQFLEIANNL
jgi:hypothetical protein